MKDFEEGPGFIRRKHREAASPRILEMSWLGTRGKSQRGTAGRRREGSSHMAWGAGDRRTCTPRGGRSQRRESQRVRAGREDCPVVRWAVGGCQPAGRGHLLSAPSPLPAQISCWCLGVVGI